MFTLNYLKQENENGATILHYTTDHDGQVVDKGVCQIDQGDYLVLDHIVRDLKEMKSSQVAGRLRTKSKTLKGNSSFEDARKWCAGENEQGQQKGETCPRCRGRGYIEAYKHVQNGVCFRCHGSGIDPDSVDRKQLEMEL